jgi:hypothetical protein
MADGWVRSWDLGAGEWHEFTAARQVRAAAFDATARISRTRDDGMRQAG